MRATIEGHAIDSRLTAAGAPKGPTGDGHASTQGVEGGSGGTRIGSGRYQSRDGRDFSATHEAPAQGGLTAAGGVRSRSGGGGGGPGVARIR
jgi:hypothetical protein